MTRISYRQRAMTITKLALIATATVAATIGLAGAVSHRRVLLQSRAVKLISLLSAVAVAACAHTTTHTTEMSKTSPATTVPTPGRGAVTFEYLQRAPVPALCEHDPGQLRNGQLPPQEGHPGNVGIALNYNTGAYKVAFGDLTGAQATPLWSSTAMPAGLGGRRLCSSIRRARSSKPPGPRGWVESTSAT
jgi:hypothetical protein